MVGRPAGHLLAKRLDCGSHFDEFWAGNNYNYLRRSNLIAPTLDTLDLLAAAAAAAAAATTTSMDEEERKKSKLLGRPIVGRRSEPMSLEVCSWSCEFAILRAARHKWQIPREFCSRAIGIN